jgi:hypothetical protein
MENHNRNGSENCPPEAVLRAFDLGDLPTPLFDTVADHLGSCADCQTVLDGLSRAADPLLEQLRRLESVPTVRHHLLGMLLLGAGLAPFTASPKAQQPPSPDPDQAVRTTEPTPTTGTPAQGGRGFGSGCP